MISQTGNRPHDCRGHLDSSLLIKPSTALRNDYQTISNMVKETAEPIYITKNGEGDMVVLSIEAYERREEMLRLRERLLYSEEERLSGARTYSEEEVLQMLKGRVMGIED